MKIIIIGCGAAGGTAAQFARKTNRKAEILVYDKEGYGQYSKCALPYVIEGKDWTEIIEFPPQWFERNGIEYRNEEIYKIDFEGRIVEGEKEEEFDKLVIATGAMPACPFEASGVHFLRNLNDALGIKEAVKKANNAIIVGAGLIGMEVAEALIRNGLKVKVLEYMPSILPAMLDKDVADYVMKKLGVEVLLDCKVEKVEDGVVIAGEEHKADLIIVATGNKPNVLDGGEAIKVDEKCNVSNDVYAAGDCTVVKDFFGREVVVGLGSIAARQGRVAGINAAGGNDSLIPPVFAKTTKLFGLEIASVGLLSNEIDGVAARYIGKDLPHYMEGDDLLVKVIADKNGIIVGCQVVGRGAAKIVDRITLAIYNRMGVKEIARIENAYAPSVAPTFDAIEVACSMIERKLK